MTQIDIEKLRGLLAKATSGPWAYRPRQHDDWGFIRVALADAEGWQPIVALGRSGPVGDDHDEHRRNKTDPYRPNSELIVAAVNALPALLSELERKTKALEDVRNFLPHDHGFFAESVREIASTALKGEHHER